MHIKICGITQAEDARVAVASGAQAIGLVFHSGSRRYVSVEAAAALSAVVPPFTQLVGLFVNADPEVVSETLARVPINVLQFHGQESGDYCRQFGRPWIKALPAEHAVPLAERLSEYHGARGVLLDSASAGQFGGTGQVFDWGAVPSALSLPVVLAGGLNPDNVGDAIRMVRPNAVDVSSGVESAPGIKDAVKVRRFISNAMAAAKELEQ